MIINCFVRKVRVINKIYNGFKKYILDTITNGW